MNPAARAAYEAALTAIDRRKRVRDVALRPPEYSEQLGQRVRDAVKEMAAAGWTTEMKQLAVHASPDVLAVLRAAESADNQARIRFTAWSALAERNRYANEHAGAGLPAHFASSDATMGAFNAIGPAVVAADQADDVLATVITMHLSP